MNTVNNECASVSEATLEVFAFAERALLDFGLFDEFKRRSSKERRQSLNWLAGARSSKEEEDRVSRLLDALWFGKALPGPDRSANVPEQARR
jgi:hypothetical protein